ncbi:hypothetical protein PPH93_28815 [Achromobacter xylosoxidans]|uniref:Lipoprotein n=1 Tax=Alcaligenes xylosoxydans xylosoxydans TaxID=85698 RepID=A0A9W5AEG4_ALCXX|nr:hypothetical protein [Achromobacter xylosoxidans]MCZ8404199.1 hypothetical protein [Achromobacter xylosoxidans]MDC6165676.1 hypothetical protein [Achromobacter xylosoxidans]CUJ20245.1 Uncharacterised protein [Achromobacter xylosoxidans]
MARAARLALLTVCAAVALTGCDSSPPPPPAGSRFTAETLATQETPPELQFRGELAGKPIHLLMHECKVYKVDSAEGGNVAWTLVLEGDFSLLPTRCVRQELTAGKGFVKAFIGRQAFGAGGCCAGIPEYRSTDGLTWKPR